MENTRYSRTPANLSTERLRCALCWVVCVAAIALHGDTLTTSIDQRTGGGQWHAVGNLHFHAGNAGCVSIGNSGTDGYVIADAVRFAQGATEIVVDNSDGNHVETVGSWASSSSTTHFYGSDYLHDGNTGKGEKSITFRPALPSSGEYEVSIRWTSATNRASNVPVLVEYNIAPPAWQLTVSGAGGSGEYAAEVPVALSATAPRPNMRFDRWTCNPPGHFTDPFAPQTTLTMPDTHATVVAVWRDDTEAVLETARSLPVASVVDIVIIGANVGAVGAALRAAGDGADVLLVSPDYFVGSEMCAQNRYWLGPNETPESATAQALFGTRASSAGYHFVEPGDFKRTAERLLQEAGVKMLYKSYGVGVVLDHAGNPGGVVIANKAGRQVVVAKQMIDATPTGVVASTAGATREAWPAGLIQVSRTHYGSAISGTNCTAIGDYTECILSANMLTGSWRERCQAEMQLRTAYDLGDANWPAQAMHMLEPNRIVTEATHIGTWPGAEALDLACCRPADVPNVHMLSGMCGVSRDAAADLMRPVALLRLGDRIGAEAHARADALSTPSGLSVRATTVSGAKARSA